MSDKDRAKADDDVEGGPAEREDMCKGCGRKGRRVPFFRLKKSKKLLHQKRKQKGIFVNSRACLCLRQPNTLDASGESPSSDPNSSDFTFDMLRALIEKNDFYSQDCNPPFDAADDGDDM